MTRRLPTQTDNRYHRTHADLRCRWTAQEEIHNCISTSTEDEPADLDDPGNGFLVETYVSPIFYQVERACSELSSLQ